MYQLNSVKPRRMAEFTAQEMEGHIGYMICSRSDSSLMMLGFD